MSPCEEGSAFADEEGGGAAKGPVGTFGGGGGAPRKPDLIGP